MNQQKKVHNTHVSYSEVLRNVGQVPRADRALRAQARVPEAQRAGDRHRRAPEEKRSVGAV